MTSLRGILPQQSSSYAGKVEASTEKTAYDSVWRLLWPTQKTTYSGKTGVVPPVVTYNFFNNVFSNILREVNDEVWPDDKCD